MILPILAGLAGVALARNPRKRRKARRNPGAVHYWWDDYPTTNGRKPYRVSFLPEGKGSKRIWWIRYGTNMEATFDLAKTAAKTDYPKASGFMIESAQRDNPKGWTWAHAKARATRKRRKGRK